jgi:4-amino-4-deoxy-L-arabinose transferase-like glycosyltransferase
MECALSLLRSPRGALAALVLVGLAILLPTLEAGHVDPYDELASVAHGRRMLEANKYLFTVDHTGAYALAGVTKPPLFLAMVAMSMKLFGLTIWAARLPSALAALGLAILAFLWARRLRPDGWGTVWGALWALFIFTVEGTFTYSGAVCIEPVFSLFAVLALFAFTAIDVEAPQHGGRLALAALAGAMLGCAFLTKQLAAGVAVLPVIVTAIVFARARLARAAGVLAVAGAVAMLIAGGWLWWFTSTLGSDAVDYLFKFSVEQRVGGFQGTRHYNWLNRFSDLVDGVVAPLPMGLSVVGLIVLAVRHRGGEGYQSGAQAAAPLAYALTAVLAFELVSKSVLEWYACHLIFPLVGGATFLLARGLEAAWSDADAPSTARGERGRALELGLAVAVTAMCIDRAAQELYSRLFLVAALAGVVALVAIVRAGGQRPGRRAALAATGVVLVVTGARLARHDHFNESPAFRASIMRILDDEGVRQTTVAANFLGAGRDSKAVRDRRREAYFGPTSVTGRAPWDGGPKADAYVTFSALPEEVAVRDGIRALRGLAGVAYVGDLSARPFATDAFERALRTGPLTFQAEHLPSAHGRSLVRRRGAAGGFVREVAPWMRDRAPKRPLASIPHLTLKPGKYEAVFVVSWRCEGLALREHLATLRAGRGYKRISCAEGDKGAEDYRRMSVPFVVHNKGDVRVTVDYKRGAVGVDAIEIWRKQPPVDDPASDESSPGGDGGQPEAAPEGDGEATEDDGEDDEDDDERASDP